MVRGITLLRPSASRPGRQTDGESGIRDRSRTECAAEVRSDGLCPPHSNVCCWFCGACAVGCLGCMRWLMLCCIGGWLFWLYVLLVAFVACAVGCFGRMRCRFGCMCCWLLHCMRGRLFWLYLLLVVLVVCAVGCCGTFAVGCGAA